MLSLENIDCRKKEPMFNTEHLCSFISFPRTYYFSVLGAGGGGKKVTF